MEAKDLEFNPFEQIGRKWGLVCAGDAEKSNGMTVSWGGTGVLWGKDVVFIFIRESRFTKEFIDAGNTFSLSFFADEYHPALQLCGKESGRDMDKWKAAGLTPVTDMDTVYPAEAGLAFLCRKMAAVPVKADSFIDETIENRWYADHDMHTMYVGEILKVVKQ